MLAKTSNVYLTVFIVIICGTNTHLGHGKSWTGIGIPGFLEIDAEITIGGPVTSPKFNYGPDPGHGPPPYRRPQWRRRGRPGPGRPRPPPDFHENPFEEGPPPHVRPHQLKPYPENNLASNNNIDDICGITHNSRIVGGVNAHPNKWIWMAALIRTDESHSYCGGSLITKRHVLTAAHCVNNLTPKDMFVRLGSYDFSDNADASAEDINASSFHIHPDFDKYSYLNDIAIIVLEKEASFSDIVRPICLPPQRRRFFGQLATVIGWGYKSYASGEKPEKLREVTVPIWNDTQCNEAYKRDFGNKALCAGYAEGGKDSCQGDSGGPLMVQTARRKWCIVGIVSFGQNCGEPGYPGVYTRVNQFRPWIKRTISETEQTDR